MCIRSRQRVTYNYGHFTFFGVRVMARQLFLCLICVIYILVRPITHSLHFYRNVYYVKTLCRAQKWLFPLS